jgi:hypothetical protein
MNVAEVCTRARDLILRDGFTHGGDGWYGVGGWCIEGALGAALGLDYMDTNLSMKVNHSPAGVAIRHHIHLWDGCALHAWNDRSGTREGVLRVLAEVAAAYDGTPVESVPADEVVLHTLGGTEITLSMPKVLPPMPEPKQEKVWFKVLLGV